MNIIFNKVIMHNFLSFGHSEIDLKNKGYCLVKGINNNPKDNAISNGSGKSSWSSAICWALTGETIQGLSTNIKNINIDEDECYVSVEFTINRDEYIVTRYNAPKSDLKITYNGNDISGKGIRESEQVLTEYLPDLTSELIGSIIILGQGLPYKFSNNSPSGRKQVLEKLSKSDFMILDLKNRLNDRLTKLETNLRKTEDTLLVLNTKEESVNNEILKLNNKLEELNKVEDYDSIIQTLNFQLVENEKKNKEIEEKLKDKNKDYTDLTNCLNEVIDAKNKELNEDTNEYNSLYSEYLNKKSTLDSDIKVLQSKIKSLKDIKDICPTCGQKIPNVIKPSTEKEEEELNNLNTSLIALNESYTKNSNEHTKVTNSINNKYKIRIDGLNKEINELKKEIAEIHSMKLFDLADLRAKLATITSDKKNYDQNLKEVKLNLEEANNSLKKLQDDILYSNNEKQSINSHINVLNQMNTFIKRDFRGFLLANVIDFISKKSKEYSLDIFGTDELEFYLDGNNIDISYCKKSFENLSGGEKQKVDLIIQFAIRDMMSQYLNFSSNILVLDEIFDQLDILSCTNVLNLISHKLNDIESIFIVSHNDSLEIPYDSEMIVIKNEEGISRIN